MKCGVVRETYPGERRVALVPAVLPALVKAGMTLVIEAGAGQAAGFPDKLYQDQGATVVPRREDVFAAADIVIQVRALGANCEAGITDLGLVRSGQTIVAFCEPLGAPRRYSNSRPAASACSRWR